MNYLTKQAVEKFPYLGVIKRDLIAKLTSLFPLKQSYSQYKEDLFLSQKLKKYDLSKSIYIDIGSNHPTSISNTYLFYRNGCRGVAIEPNFELSQLHKKIRPKDIVLNIGCGNEPELGRLQIGKAPVLSYFLNNSSDEDSKQREHPTKQLGFRYWRSEYIPILPLDLIATKLDYEWIFLLSIDVEGFDYKVLEGSCQTLTKVLFCCIEANNEAEAKKIEDLLTEKNFQLEQKMQCNYIYKNQNSLLDRYIVP